MFSCLDVSANAHVSTNSLADNSYALKTNNIPTLFFEIWFCISEDRQKFFTKIK